MRKVIAYTVVGIGFVMLSLAVPSGAAPTTSSDTDLGAQIKKLHRTPAVITTIKAPKLSEPAWLKAQNAAEQAALGRAQQSTGSQVVTYDVMTRGTVTANLAEFRTLANATLNDSRGWAQMGISFKEVASGGMFTLVLSEASQVPSFSSGCGAEYSCRVGRYVIINQDRWQGATPSWNNAGGSLRGYRHMVVNHETGHWLGHGHATECGTQGLAKVMQQQSINLHGCAFNPWPVASELYSPQLGITL
ncbi:MAG TPA: DUF3152 domain-containing protein [Candidatus Saccharimonadales bacterium]|nr:DUF3152 domain-containing protein [Candidatus Saccharimonadales bacterium]